MSDYDEEGRRILDHREDRLELDVRASAEAEEEAPSIDHPFQYVDSESLASHNLKLIRKQLGVSQQQIAERLLHVQGGMVKLAQTQIAKIERGERPWRVNEMFAIAEALGVHWTEFFRAGPKEELEDDSHLIMLGARIKYKQAEDRVSRAREAWEEAASEALKAGLEMVNTAVELGIEDEAVMHFLEMRHATLRSMDEDEDRVYQIMKDQSWSVDERMRESQEWARAEWNRLLEEKAEKENQKALEGHGEEEDHDMGVPPWGRRRKRV